MTLSARTVLTFAIVAATTAPAFADEPSAIEDTWWQVDGRDRAAYLEAGVEVIVDDGNVEGAMGEAGNVELTTGYWLVPYAAAEMQLSVGRAISPGVFSETRVESTLAGVGVGARLALPIRLSPVFAAHIGYRQVFSERASLTCGAECANREAIAIDHVPDQQVIGDAAAGLQLNLGSFSMTATFEYTTAFTGTDTAEAMTRGPDPEDDPAEVAEVGLNLQAGVRF